MGDFVSHFFFLIFVMMKEELYKNNFSIPDRNTASRFSIEMTFNEDPCGFHAIDKYHSRDKIKSLFNTVI